MAVRSRVTMAGRPRVTMAGEQSEKGDTVMGSKIDTITGRIKEAVGVLMDNDTLQREGQRDQVVGAVKEKAARAAKKVKDAVERAVEKVKNV